MRTCIDGEVEPGLAAFDAGDFLSLVHRSMSVRTAIFQQYGDAMRDFSIGTRVALHSPGVCIDGLSR